MSKFKVMLLGSVAAGLTLGTTSGVIAGEVEKSASTKGHVARLIGTQDDGGSATLQHQDSDRSGSRFYMMGKAKSESMELVLYNRSVLTVKKTTAQPALVEVLFH